MKNRKKDLMVIRKHWENRKAVSLKDKNLQELERCSILAYLKRLGRVGKIADIGCGDCLDTLSFAPFAKKVFGYDYSSSMLEKAKKNTKGRVDLSRFDLIKDELPGKFDVVITKRCLINLGSFKNQVESIKKIRCSLKKGGYYLMLECSQDGLKNLNLLRTKFGLSPLKEPFHNLYFDFRSLIKELGRYFTFDKISNFSTYYFLTRVYNQSLDSKGFERFDNLAKKSQLEAGFLNSLFIGPQFLLALKKK